LEHTHGKGTCLTIPWEIGKHYQKLGNHAHALLFRRTLHDLAGLEPSVIANTSPLVEVCSQIRKDGKWQLISLVNHSGQNGSAFLEPLPIRDIGITLACDAPVSKVRALRNQVELDFSQADRIVRCVLPNLGLFETVVVE
jgi:hypothetical protein